MRSISILTIVLAIAAAIQSAPLDAKKGLAADKPSTEMLCPWVPGCIKQCGGNKDCIQLCIDDCPRRGRDGEVGARPQAMCPWVPECIQRCNGDRDCIRDCVEFCPPRGDEPLM
ncbi:hypothetical protein BCR44DRAFT_55451 [Catenaria anguillulae PL171]|uniref:4Fe-4S ferredoxin-type domain-containing protein n=1 Tax=Catenaria anguillulae PL171 TaxID=765915 RepID=A0A1Y2HP73_9FUNG|nr:hypothetical protein BCR44DRAFT_55451 [Catenaria anguillulae PL171]